MSNSIAEIAQLKPPYKVPIPQNERESDRMQLNLHILKAVIEFITGIPWEITAEEKDTPTHIKRGMAMDLRPNHQSFKNGYPLDSNLNPMLFLQPGLILNLFKLQVMVIPRADPYAFHILIENGHLHCNCICSDVYYPAGSITLNYQVTEEDKHDPRFQQIIAHYPDWKNY